MWLICAWSVHIHMPGCFLLLFSFFCNQTCHISVKKKKKNLSWREPSETPNYLHPAANSKISQIVTWVAPILSSFSLHLDASVTNLTCHCPDIWLNEPNILLFCRLLLLFKHVYNTSSSFQVFKSPRQCNFMEKNCFFKTDVFFIRNIFPSVKSWIWPFSATLNSFIKSWISNNLLTHV